MLSSYPVACSGGRGRGDRADIQVIRRRPPLGGSAITIEAAMLKLRQIEHDILARGKVDGPELEELRQQLYVDGKMHREEADFLVGLDRRMQHRTPAFVQFFYQAIKDHMLTDGWIDAQDVAWLRKVLFADRKIEDEERKFLHELRGEAKNTSREFQVLFDQSMKRPQEQHTCG
jgi:hypothetical protein